jgi:hypothetical protein
MPRWLAQSVDSVVYLGSRRRLAINVIHDMSSAEVEEEGQIRPASETQAHTPVAIDPVVATAPIVQRFQIAPRRFRVLRDVQVAGHSTCAFSDKNCLVPTETFQQRREVRVEGDAVMLRGSDAVLRAMTPPQRSVTEGIFLGGRGADNWYHFVVEILPRLHMLHHDLPEHLQALPLLVPEATLASRASQELIRLLAPTSEILPISGNSMTSVERMLWTDVPVRSAYKLDRWVDIQPHHEALDVIFFREFRAALMSLAGVASACPGSARLFLDRGSQDARPYNREDVLAVAGRLGFTILDLGALSAVEQIAAVANSSALLGPHGAAWTSLLFAHPDSRALTITPRLDRVAGFSGFQNLAAVSGARLRDLTVDASGPSWSVPVDVLHAMVELELGSET